MPLHPPSSAPTLPTSVAPVRPDPGRHFHRFLWVNAALLTLSMVANLFMERPTFSVAHAVMLAAVAWSGWMQHRAGWRVAKRWYLAALAPYLISFAFIGRMESFDIVWMLLFPGKV